MTEDQNSIRPWMKFNCSLNRRYDGRSLSSFLTSGGKNNVELSPVFSYVLTPTSIKWRDLYALMAPSIRSVYRSDWGSHQSEPFSSNCNAFTSILQRIFNLSQRYITRYSENKVRKEHLRFNCEGDITLRFRTGFNGSVWNWKGQCARTFDSANFDHNRNLYLLDYSLGLMIEICSRDVSMSQLSTFLSIVEEFQSHKT